MNIDFAAKFLDNLNTDWEAQTQPLLIDIISSGKFTERLEQLCLLIFFDSFASVNNVDCEKLRDRVVGGL